MIGGSGNMLCSTCSQNLIMGEIKGFFGEPLKHVITLRGQIVVSRSDGDLFFSPSFCPFLLCVKWVGGGGERACTFKTPTVCRFKTSPCVPAPRAQVFSTCARGARTHGDVLTHGGFSACHGTHHDHSHKPQRHTTM